MSSIILYFSRTGNSKRIAEKIVRETGSPIARITDEGKWNGVWGFLRGGMYASKWKQTTPVIEQNPDLSAYDHIVIVSPVWASNAAPAVYSLILQGKVDKEKVCMVIDSAGSESEAAFKNIEGKLGPIPDKFGIVLRKGNQDEVIGQVAAWIKSNE